MSTFVVPKNQPTPLQLPPRPLRVASEEAADAMMSLLLVTADVLDNIHPLEMLGSRKSARHALARWVWVQACRRTIWTRRVYGPDLPANGLREWRVSVAEPLADAPVSGYRFGAWQPVSFPVLEKLTGKDHSTFVVGLQKLRRSPELLALVDAVVDKLAQDR